MSMATTPASRVIPSEIGAKIKTEKKSSWVVKLGRKLARRSTPVSTLEIGKIETSPLIAEGGLLCCYPQTIQELFEEQFKHELEILGLKEDDDIDKDPVMSPRLLYLFNLQMQWRHECEVHDTQQIVSTQELKKMNQEGANVTNLLDPNDTNPLDSSDTNPLDSNEMTNEQWMTIMGVL